MNCSSSTDTLDRRRNLPTAQIPLQEFFQIGDSFLLPYFFFKTFEKAFRFQLDSKIQLISLSTFDYALLSVSQVLKP